MDGGVGATLILTCAIAGRAFGALLFGAATVAKARHAREFVLIVARYLAMPIAVARGAAIVVAGLEAATALLLALSPWPSVGALLAMLLLLGFAAAMARALARGERALECGCMYGALRQRVRWELVARNVVLASCFVPLLVAPGSSDEPMVLVDGIASGALLFVLTHVFSLFLALDESFAELKRRYG